MFVFLFEHVKLRSIIIIGGTNERCSACSNNRTNTNNKEMKKFNYKLEIEIFRNSILKYLGVLRGSFLGFGCPKRHPDVLLAKTMTYPLLGVI